MAQYDLDKQTLESFGKFLIGSIRKPTIEQLRKIVRGEMKGVSGQRFKELFKDFTPEQLSIVDQSTEFAIDAVLHQLLFNAETDQFRILFKSDGGEYINIADLSDGLAGELYTDDGWIKKFS